MKRFLSFLAVFVLALSLAVPVGATNDVELPDIDSVWTDRTTYPYAYVLRDNAEGWTELTLTEKPLLWYGSKVEAKSSTAFKYQAYALSGDSWVDNGNGIIPQRTAISNTSSNTREIIWSSFNIVHYTTGEVYMYATNAKCDGSSCPAVDVNIDGICDGCGMTLMSLSRTPVAPSVNGSNKNYVMFYSGTVYKYTVYTSDESYTIRGEEYGARYRTYIDPSATAQRFESYDGINWEQTYNGLTANDYPGEVGYELISSTFDWYTDEGEHFFPVPLWEEVQSVTQGEMGNLTAETAGTTKTLVVCGVGLMACLMVLSLFGKRWLIFLR